MTSRAWTVSVSPYKENFKELCDEKTKEDVNLKYMIVGEEEGDIQHCLQGYLWFHTAVDRSSVQSWVETLVLHQDEDPVHVDIHVSQRTQAAAIVFCKKRGKFHEWGDPANISDHQTISLQEAQGLIQAGMSSKHIQHHLRGMMRYSRTLDRMEDAYLGTLHRSHMTKGIWIWGKTGVGKTHWVYDTFNAKEIFDFDLDCGGWKYYEPLEHRVVLFDNFDVWTRKKSPGTLKQLVDRYPLDIYRGWKDHAPFLAQYLIVTSLKPMEEVFRKISKDDLEGLHRRFEVRHMT